MSCLWRSGASLESALRKGDVDAVLAALGDDPLRVVCRTFRTGDSLWHLAANGGHVQLLAALVHRLREVWPSSRAPPSPPAFPSSPASPASHDDNGDAHPHPPPHPTPHPHPHPPLPCGRRSAAHNPFQRLSEGLLGPRLDPCAMSLAGWLSAPNLLGQTPLMSAARRGHGEAVKYLLSVGASPWSRDRGHCSVLHYAALGNSADVVAAVLQHPASARPPPGTRQRMARSLVDLPNAWGYTPAHFAAAAGKPAALAALLAGGANIAARCWGEGHDWITGSRGYTPLHMAARRGDEAMCRMVLRHYLEVLRDSGAVDPRLLADWRGVRPFSVALERGNKALAEILLPSTPLSYVFSGSDAVRLYNVPKLKALAAAALQEALLGQIASLEAAVTARRQQAAEAAVAEARAAQDALAAAAAERTRSGVEAGGDGGAVAAAAAPTSPSAMSRASSSLAATVSGALDAVRRQSLRLQQRLRPPRAGQRRVSGEVLRGGSGAPSGGSGGDGFQAAEAALLRCSEDCSSGAATAAPSGVHRRVTSFGRCAAAGAGGSPRCGPPAPASSAASGVSYMPYTADSATSAAAAADIPWLGASSRSPPPARSPPPFALPGGASPPLPGGISPVRGSSFEAERVPCGPPPPPPPPMLTAGAQAPHLLSAPALNAVPVEWRGVGPTDGGGGGGGGAANGAAVNPRGAPHALLPLAPPLLLLSPFAQTSAQLPPPASPPPPLLPQQQPQACGTFPLSGDGVGHSSPLPARTTTTAAAAAAATAYDGDAVVGGSPRGTLWSMLTSLGRGGGGGGGNDSDGYALGSAAESRRGSGRLPRLGSRSASRTLSVASGLGGSGAAAAAAAGGGDGTIAVGSDTSENCCGICFERPAVLNIRSCRHVLCAECAREVTRMVETQPPSCPFCRGVVRGFGC